MQAILREIDVCTTLSIIRLYPEWKQANIARDGTPEDKQRLTAWIDENKAYGDQLKEKVRYAEDPDEIEIDEGWPDPKQWRWDQIGEKVLGDLEASKAKIDGKTFRFSITALQDEFDPKADADLGATDSRLSAEFDDLEARLKTVSPEGLDRHTELSGKLFTKTGA